MEPASLPAETISLPVVLQTLQQRLGAWAGRGLVDRLLALLLYQQIAVIGRLMAGLLARHRRGIVWRRAGTAALPRASVTVTGRARRVPVWPTRFGWLLRAGAHEAAGLSAQLRFVLEQPEMVALLQAAPQAGRVLRPLCRALAIGAEVLQPGLAPAEPRVPKPKMVRVRKPRPKLDLGRIPLPRGMLSAARRAGFGKLR